MTASMAARAFNELVLWSLMSCYSDIWVSGFSLILLPSTTGVADLTLTYFPPSSRSYIGCGLTWHQLFGNSRLSDNSVMREIFFSKLLPQLVNSASSVHRPLIYIKLVYSALRKSTTCFFVVRFAKRNFRVHSGCTCRPRKTFLAVRVNAVRNERRSRSFLVCAMLTELQAELTDQPLLSTIP